MGYSPGRPFGKDQKTLSLPDTISLLKHFLQDCAPGSPQGCRAALGFNADQHGTLLIQ